MIKHINGISRIRRIIVTVVMLLVMASGLVFGATDNGAYEVTEYNFHAVVDKTHSYKVVQKISVNLPSKLDTVSFMVPNGNYRVFDLKVEGTEYKRSRNEAENIISIVDADKLTKGTHTYKIEYTIKEFEDRDAEKDMFYFDVLLPSWSQPISKLSIKVEFPEDFPWTDMQYYAGQYGVQNVNTKLNYKADAAAKTVTITGKKIPENFGITIKDQLPNGYWEGALNGMWAINAALAIMLGIVLLLLIMWFIGGRDPKVSRIEQAHPIDGITPAEIGYIFNTRVRTRDLISLIVYWGTKSYLKISEYEPKKYRLIKKEYPKQEEKFIRNAYDILFEDVLDDRWIEMEDLGGKLVRIKKAIEEDVAAGFSSKEMSAFTSLSKLFRNIGIALIGLGLGAACVLKYSYQYMNANLFEAVIVAALTWLVLSLLCKQSDRQNYSDESSYTLVLIGLIMLYVGLPVYVAVSGYMLTGQLIPAIAVFVSALVGGLMTVIMRARAKGNAILAGRFKQLRHFIYHPTATTLAANYFADSNYYNEIVPYALYFNGLETWSISFLTLDVPEPDWYSDDIEGNAFTKLRGKATVLDYAKDIKTFARTIEDAYHSMKRRHKK